MLNLLVTFGYLSITAFIGMAALKSLAIGRIDFLTVLMLVAFIRMAFPTSSKGE